MERCPRCALVGEAGWAYCPACGRTRILESLRAPVVQPAWLHQAWRALVFVASLWLVVTVAVAFIREAKAVRDSRALLAEGKSQEAWRILQPFLSDHPEHKQALFLCGKATIRLGLRAEPKQCLQQVDKLSPELAKELREDYGQILTRQSRSLNCDAKAFEALLDWGDELGANFAGNILGGLDGVVRACRAAQNERELMGLASALAARGKAMSLIERGYVPAIGMALAQARYQDAEGLAQQAVRLVPEGKKAVEEALKPERQKVAATTETLQRLRDVLKSDPRNRSGAFWCFPNDVPPAVQSARDGWGNAILYRPQGGQIPASDQPDKACWQGFVLTSYGGDGVETQRDWQQNPDAEIVYSFSYGGESWQIPNRFWWPQQ